MHRRLTGLAPSTLRKLSWRQRSQSLVHCKKVMCFSHKTFPVETTQFVLKTTKPWNPRVRRVSEPTLQQTMTDTTLPTCAVLTCDPHDSDVRSRTDNLLFTFQEPQNVKVKVAREGTPASRGNANQPILVICSEAVKQIQQWYSKSISVQNLSKSVSSSEILPGGSFPFTAWWGILASYMEIPHASDLYKMHHY